MTIETDPKYIREKKEEIIKYIQENNLSLLREKDEFTFMMKMYDKFPEFSQKYKTLFKTIIMGEDLEPLEHFLMTIEKLKKGKGNRIKEEEKLGYYLADKYLPQNLKNEINKNKKN
jgi:hypothetical protein